MLDDASLNQLRSIQAQADAIREKLSIHAPNEVLFLADHNELDEEQIVLEADGFGGSKLRVVAGNYPIDFHVLLEHSFDSEATGSEIAEKIVDDGTWEDADDLQEILLEYSRRNSS